MKMQKTAAMHRSNALLEEQGRLAASHNRFTKNALIGAAVLVGINVILFLLISVSDAILEIIQEHFYWLGILPLLAGIYIPLMLYVLIRRGNIYDKKMKSLENEKAEVDKYW